MTRTPFDTAGIGHNQGPSLLAGSWSGYCWTRARRQVWDNPPIEVVRRRKRRADELGLTYRQYTGVLLDKGTRTEALVVDLTRLETVLHPAPLESVAAKLRAVRNCKIFAAVETVGHMLDEINGLAGGVIADCAIYPKARGASPAFEETLTPVLDMLSRNVVAPAAAVMIGDGRRALAIAASARLARVFPYGAYFGRAY